MAGASFCVKVVGVKKQSVTQEQCTLVERNSSRGRKSVTDPRVLFKILVYGYQCGIYTTRKLEEACRYRIDFKWLLWDEPVPDHSTISRFRTGRCAEAVEDLFYQYVRYLEEQGETDHETVFIDGTKLESRAGRYTFVWRKSAEKQLVKVKEKVFSAVSITSLEALEQRLAEMETEISFVHGPGRRKSDAQKEWEALDELRRRWRAQTGIQRPDWGQQRIHHRHRCVLQPNRLRNHGALYGDDAA